MKSVMRIENAKIRMKSLEGIELVGEENSAKHWEPKEKKKRAKTWAKKKGGSSSSSSNDGAKKKVATGEVSQSTFSLFPPTF